MSIGFVLWEHRDCFSIDRKPRLSQSKLNPYFRTPDLVGPVFTLSVGVGGSQGSTQGLHVFCADRGDDVGD